MATRKCLYLLAPLLTEGLGGCSTAVQLHRDSLRYDTFVRGTEVYSTNGLSSIEAMAATSENNVGFYERYKEILANYDPGTRQALAEAERIRTGARTSAKPASEETIAKRPSSARLAERDSGATRTPRARSGSVTSARTDEFFSLPLAPRLPVDTEQDEGNPKSLTPPGGGSGRLNSATPAGSVAQMFWPLGSITDVHETTATEFSNDKPAKTNITKPNETAVLALSSIASMAQMRDLLTEPSFPQMVPKERHVRLGCLPPADNIVFESMDALKAAAAASDNNQAIKNIVSQEGGSDEQQQTRKRQLEANLALTSQTLAVKAVQETQKTWFLQWALFRLCEAGLNSTEVRNTVPVVIHDIVRRTAEMSDSAEGEITKRIAAEEDTRRAEIEKSKAIELEVQKRETAVSTADVQQKVIDSQTALTQQQTELQKLSLQLEERKRVNLCMDMTRKEKPNISFSELRKACE